MTGIVRPSQLVVLLNWTRGAELTAAPSATQSGTGPDSSTRADPTLDAGSTVAKAMAEVTDGGGRKHRPVWRPQKIIRGYSEAMKLMEAGNFEVARALFLLHHDADRSCRVLADHALSSAADRAFGSASQALLMGAEIYAHDGSVAMATVFGFLGRVVHEFCPENKKGGRNFAAYYEARAFLKDVVQGKVDFSHITAVVRTRRAYRDEAASWFDGLEKTADKASAEGRVRESLDIYSLILSLISVTSHSDDLLRRIDRRYSQALAVLFEQDEGSS